MQLFYVQGWTLTAFVLCSVELFLIIKNVCLSYRKLALAV